MKVKETTARLELKLPTVQYGNLLIDVGVVVEDDSESPGPGKLTKAQEKANEMALSQLKALRDEVDKLDQEFFEKV